jgi:hypothetical protein
MKNLLFFLIITVSITTAGAEVYYDTGLTYTIGDTNPYDGTIYIGNNINGPIFLDSYIANDPGTHLNLNSGGSIGTLFTEHNSTATINGGIVNGGLYVRNNSTVVMSGGAVTNRFNIYQGGGVLYLNGTNFVLTTGGETIDLINYSHLSDYCTLTKMAGMPDHYTGTITGILADGSQLNNEFYIYRDSLSTSDIVIIPEPATMLFFAFGGLILRKRKTVS